jgi:hypothetical protein
MLGIDREGRNGACAEFRADPGFSGRQRRSRFPEAEPRTGLRLGELDAGTAQIRRIGLCGSRVDPSVPGENDGLELGADHTPGGSVFAWGEGACTGEAVPPAPTPAPLSAEDTVLPAAVDDAHGTLSGPATCKLLQRAHQRFGEPQYERLAQPSVAQLYRFRQTWEYRHRRRSISPRCLAGLDWRAAPARAGRLAGLVARRHGTARQPNLSAPATILSGCRPPWY